MNRPILVLGIPLLGAALVIAAVASRKPAEPGSTVRKKSPAPVHVDGPSQLAPPRPPAPKPAPEKTIARAMDEARVKTTYQNFRTALATGNRVQADALHSVLLQDRKAALRLAEQDLAQARQEFDRTVAEQALDALRR